MTVGLNLGACHPKTLGSVVAYSVGAQLYVQRLPDQRFYLVTWYHENLLEADFLRGQLCQYEGDLFDLRYHYDSLRDRYEDRGHRIEQLEALLAAARATTGTPPSVPTTACVEVLSSPSTSTAEGLVGLAASPPIPGQPVAVMAQVPSEEEELKEVEPHVLEELHADREPQEEIQEI
ncbi:hypothetical protein E2562_012013 [Oryza meyeriana var. granulata]|uniref:Uncharacterized protein n=1 Tax=Oryza meyeriana var. granulata TaxID=110450 RepID=A0A6G1F7A7_9ORYZ|nr:hypothetical protein E2562_012013 [Oryza meyeriana var. granulata]